MAVKDRPREARHASIRTSHVIVMRAVRVHGNRTKARNAPKSALCCYLLRRNRLPRLTSESTRAYECIIIQRFSRPLLNYAQDASARRCSAFFA